MANMILGDLIDSIFAERLQELEVVVYDMFSRMDINSWGGVHLDRVGALIGCTRLGLTDADYRMKIKAFSAQQNCDGRIGEVLHALKLITGASQVNIQNLGDATVMLYTNGSLGSFLTSNLTSFMEGCLGAGIEIDSILYWGTDDSFGFSNISDTITTVKGFDNIAGTGGGGTFNYILV